MTHHDLKVWPPYYAALADGSKTFEVRKNDRAFQAGDTVGLNEWDPSRCVTRCKGEAPDCPGWTGSYVSKRITYVYMGDTRFGGIEPGFVVLALGTL